MKIKKILDFLEVLFLCVEKMFISKTNAVYFLLEINNSSIYSSDNQAPFQHFNELIQVLVLQ